MTFPAAATFHGKREIQLQEYVIATAPAAPTPAPGPPKSVLRYGVSSCYGVSRVMSPWPERAKGAKDEASYGP